MNPKHSPKENESKESKFKRIATARTKKILKYLNLLGNCSSSNYEYTKEQIEKIFDTINKQVNDVHNKFDSSKTKEIEFDL